MEKMEILKITPDKEKGCSVENYMKQGTQASKALPEDTECILEDTAIMSDCYAERVHNDKTILMDDDKFFDLISNSQRRRIDDQRYEFSTDLKDNDAGMDIVSGTQSARLEDPHALLLPGLTSNITVQQYNRVGNSEVLDDEFFNHLMQCQANRIEEQRSLPPVVPGNELCSASNKVQSHHLDKQRTSFSKIKSYKFLRRKKSQKDST